MSWHYLPELAAESSAGSCSAGEPSVPWKKSRTDERCSSDANGTVCCPCSRSGTMCEPSTADLGVGSWMSSLRAFRASRSALRARGLVQTIRETSGRRLEEWSARPGLPLFSSRMCPARSGTLFKWSDLSSNEWITASHRLPLLPPPAWVRAIAETVSGYLPTLTKRDSRTLKGAEPPPGHQGTLSLAALFQRYLPAIVHVPGGRVNPTWAEFHMGYPLQWTALQPLEMDKYRSWRRSHSECLQEN